MANYSTEAVVSTAPLKGVPSPVLHLLELLSGYDVDGATEYIETLDGRPLVDSLKEYGLLTLVGDGPEYGWPEEIVEAATEMRVTEYANGDEQDGLYIHWPYSMSADVGPVLQWLLHHMPEETRYIQVDAAETCSRPLADGFGGFCVVVTRGVVHWLHAAETAAQIVRVVEDTGVPIADIIEDCLGDDVDSDRVVAVLSTFLEQQGLDEKFRRFLREKVKTEVDGG